MKVLASLLLLGLGLMALQACGFLQGAAAGVTGGPSAPPEGAAPGSFTELLYVGGYAIAREAVGLFLRWKAAKLEPKP